MKSAVDVKRVVRFGVTVLTALLVTAISATAWAKDSVVVNVTNAGSAVVVNNGQAVGTIQLFYTIDAGQFAVGPFATFDVNWATVVGSKATSYGAGVTFDLVQDQQGGNVDLVPNPASFLLTGAGQSGVSHVAVNITNDKDGNPPAIVDGTDLVGNLKLDAGPSVGTVTNIQVHIRVVSRLSCLRVYNFVTDQDFNLPTLSTMNLNVPTHGANAGKVVSSQPGQISDNVLVVNVCATAEAFDLSVGLDSRFTTNPSGNPGNAVFAYTSLGEFDTSTFNTLRTTGTQSAYQQNLCLQNVSVPAASSLLVTVHSGLKDDLMATSLPTVNRTFQFGATLDSAGTSCTGSLDPLASPNPATTSLSFTVNGQ